MNPRYIPRRVARMFYPLTACHACGRKKRIKSTRYRYRDGTALCDTCYQNDSETMFGIIEVMASIRESVPKQSFNGGRARERRI